MTEPTLETIREAVTRLGDAVYRSPCPYSLQLSRLCGCEIYCKLDHLQLTGSFKERGARNRLMTLSSEQRQRGVIAASAGNHALALAYHGRELGIPVSVVMPRYAPLVKISNCRSLGATVRLEGDTYSECSTLAKAEAQKSGQTYVPGFDDPDIIAGAGTMGLEILEDVPDVDAIIVPVGGGGLIAGVGTAVKALRPSVRVVGAEAEHALTLAASMREGTLTRVDTQPTLADGLAVALAGELCFQIARRVVDDLVSVNEGQIASAVLHLLELEKAVVEGAGAVSLAAAMVPSLNLSGKKVVLCLTGGNIDVTVLGRVIERGLARDGRLCRLRVLISDRPGSLARLLTLIGGQGASIKDVSHDRSFGPVDVGRVVVILEVETRDFSHVQEVHDALTSAGFQVKKDSF